jgi:threonine dehydrogenase-like Zn-dependent dehydrogenase
MSEPLKVGDLVVVVAHAGCGHVDYRGYVKRVQSLHHGLVLYCHHCQHEVGRVPFAEFVDEYPANLPIAWLKRIPPLDELERDQIVEELTA